jgi:predicted component of type VI protein secretion system
MPKLVLQVEDRVLRECALSADVTIGRQPDNTVSVDNPAVSGRHARIARDGDGFVVEDLESRNGTFVNGERVTRQVLRHGDVVLVGKHRLLFDAEAVSHDAAANAPTPAMPDFGGTVLLDVEHQRRLLAAIEARKAAAAVPVGSLRVIGGRADREEYRLDATESIIGKSDTALVRLRGWFKPHAAIAIARMGEGYVATLLEATLLGGQTRVNGQLLQGRRGLAHGDMLQVGGLTLEFRCK